MTAVAQLEDKDSVDRHSAFRIVMHATQQIITNPDRKERGNLVFTEPLTTLFMVIWSVYSPTLETAEPWETQESDVLRRRNQVLQLIVVDSKLKEKKS